MNCYEFGANDAISEINGCGWHDWHFDGINADYEKAVVKISYHDDFYYNLDGSKNENYGVTNIAIHCINYIGAAYIGRWDESVIESIKIDSKGDLMENTLLEIKRMYDKTALPVNRYNSLGRNWHQLNLELIDGNIIKIVCECFVMKMSFSSY